MKIKIGNLYTLPSIRGYYTILEVKAIIFGGDTLKCVSYYLDKRKATMETEKNFLKLENIKDDLKPLKSKEKRNMVKDIL
jgi:hypothetical protein